MDFVRIIMMLLVSVTYVTHVLHGAKVCVPHASYIIAKQRLRKNNQKFVKPKYRSECLQWPVRQCDGYISSYFGPRKGRMHTGVDIAAMQGVPVYAAHAGKVSHAGFAKGYGKFVELTKRSGNLKTRYAHLSKVFVKPEQRVKRGQKIGTVGATGNVRAVGKDPSHLHYEVKHKNKFVNPLSHMYGSDEAMICSFLK